MITIKVAVVETNVLGVKAWHCRCLTCGWESTRKDREKIAVALSKKHVCKDVTVRLSA